LTWWLVVVIWWAWQSQPCVALWEESSCDRSWKVKGGSCFCSWKLFVVWRARMRFWIKLLKPDVNRILKFSHYLLFVIWELSQSFFVFHNL
jgi:hypothetical protein